MSDIIQIERKDLLKAHREGDSIIRQALENLVPSVFGNIMDRVTGFADICAIAGVDPAYFELPADASIRRIKSIAVEKIDLIAEVLNEGWVPDWGDENQRKYYPYFKYNKQSSGFAFLDTLFYFGFAYSGVGSRFASYELAVFAGQTFIKEYNQALLGKL